MIIRSKLNIYECLSDIKELGSNWHYENIPCPNSKVLTDARIILERLYDQYGILPARITQSIEEGIYIEFVNGSKVILEIYNDGYPSITVDSYNSNFSSIEIFDGLIDSVYQYLESMLCLLV